MAIISDTYVSLIMYLVILFAEGLTSVMHMTSRRCIPSRTEADTSDGCHDVDNLADELAEELERYEVTVDGMTGSYCICSDDLCN